MISTSLGYRGLIRLLCSLFSSDDKKCSKSSVRTKGPEHFSSRILYNIAAIMIYHIHRHTGPGRIKSTFMYEFPGKITRNILHVYDPEFISMIQPEFADINVFFTLSGEIHNDHMAPPVTVIIFQVFVIEIPDHIIGIFFVVGTVSVKTFLFPAVEVDFIIGLTNVVTYPP